MPLSAQQKLINIIDHRIKQLSGKTKIKNFVEKEKINSTFFPKKCSVSNFKPPDES